MEKPITTERTHEGKIRTIWLNREEKRNAINPEMARELVHLLQAFASSEEIRGVILRGRGKTFCAGADLAWMEEEGLPASDQPRELLPKLFHTIYAFPKPLIAMVHGKVMGGGIGLMAGADFVIAHEGMELAFSEVRLGLIPATISPFVLRRIGEFRGRQLMVTGRTIGAGEALLAGLADKIGNTDEIEQYIDYLCAEILAGAPLATSECKRLIIGVSGEPINDTLIRGTARKLEEVRQGSEAREGMQSFREKREPYWKK